MLESIFHGYLCTENCEVYDKRDLRDSSRLYDSDCIIRFIPQKKADPGGIQPYFYLKYNSVPEKTDPDIPVYTIPDGYSIRFTSRGIDWEILSHMTINFADVLISGVNKKTGETLTGYAFVFPGGDEESDLELIKDILKSVRLIK